ncbi:hypothetical protein RYA05_04720 [Pseudomonas syringae pv. actinidiae]|nr:hypothetical protein [Pseudomonas syringae pv. actinidiae]
MCKSVQDMDICHEFIQKNLHSFSLKQIRFLSAWCISRLFSLPKTLECIQASLAIDDGQAAILHNVFHGNDQAYRLKLKSLLDSIDEYSADYDDPDTLQIYTLATFNSALHSGLEVESLSYAFEALVCLLEHCSES